MMKDYMGFGEISKSNYCPKCQKVCCLSVISQLFATPWTVACKAPLSMGFSRQKYWSGLPCPSPENLPWDLPGIGPKSLGSLARKADYLVSGPPDKPQSVRNIH